MAWCKPMEDMPLCTFRANELKSNDVNDESRRVTAAYDNRFISQPE
jgi:hypothetical protein